jgi:hypothetical protein
MVPTTMPKGRVRGGRRVGKSIAVLVRHVERVQARTHKLRARGAHQQRAARTALVVNFKAPN